MYITIGRVSGGPQAFHFWLIDNMDFWAFNSAINNSHRTEKF